MKETTPMMHPIDKNGANSSELGHAIYDEKAIYNNCRQVPWELELQGKKMVFYVSL